MSPFRVTKNKWTHASVLELVQSAGVGHDPEEVIRALARQKVAELEALGWDGPPYDMDLLASFCGYRPKLAECLGDDQDACISVEEMLVNANKPLVRQRFSIGHEIGHTLFPDFARQVQRGGPQWRRVRDTNSEVEHLCQLAASEFLMPYDAFSVRMSERGESVPAILALAELFVASVEAIAHRVVDLSPNKVVAVFVEKKWKPTERAMIEQQAFALPGFGGPPMKMRVGYATASAACGPVFLPPDKSLPENSVAYTVWERGMNGAQGPHIAGAEEDWSSIGRMGRCYVEAVALPVNADVPGSVLCLLHPLN